jgi:negative modulator of initiation of replication
MKNIEIDEELYQYIATNTQFIGESASAILRRLLSFSSSNNNKAVLNNTLDTESDVDSIAATLKTEKTRELNKKAEIKIPNEKVVTISNNSQTVFNFINKEELAMQRGAVGRFLLILAALYRAHSHSFNVVTDICGRDRLYFAHSEEELAASGSSTKPRQIPESPYWVITNSNTTRKKMMLTKASTSLGYSAGDVEKIRELL